MKVNPESLRSVTADAGSKTVTGKPQSTGGPNPATAATEASPSAGAEIQISAASRELQAADAVDTGSFDASRVDQIKQAITAGQFQVNAHVVADKLIASAHDLVARGGGKGH
ncbi:MAG TPA: flagellar biosynthesis anti-sigma factor FlgM [Terracidiphilus sp.]|nr:flagellar biosynthesis anti-sigma factor FlgM [Terracidiphilus sp.]